MKNKDLSAILVNKIEEYEREGISITFYLMERRFNKVDAAVKRAAVIFSSVPPATGLSLINFCLLLFRRQQQKSRLSSKGFTSWLCDRSIADILIGAPLPALVVYLVRSSQMVS